MEELKACPFCSKGKGAAFKDNYDKFGVYCDACGAFIGVELECGTELVDGWKATYDTAEQAIAAWNNRADGWIKFEVDENGFLINIPVREKEVLVTDGKYTWTDIFINDGYEGCYFVSDYAPVDDVTHWRPLPEPPKGE